MNTDQQKAVLSVFIRVHPWLNLLSPQPAILHRVPQAMPSGHTGRREVLAGRRCGLLLFSEHRGGSISASPTIRSGGLAGVVPREHFFDPIPDFVVRFS